MLTRDLEVTTTPQGLMASLSLMSGGTYLVECKGVNTIRLARLTATPATPGSGPYHDLARGERMPIGVYAENDWWVWTRDGKSDLVLTLRELPAGPLRGREVVDVSSEDYVHESGFVLQVGGSGNVTYRTQLGTADVTETFSAAGMVAVAGTPVLLTAVRMTGTTATGLVAGLL